MNAPITFIVARLAARALTPGPESSGFIFTSLPGNTGSVAIPT